MDGFVPANEYFAWSYGGYNFPITTNSYCRSAGPGTIYYVQTDTLIVDGYELYSNASLFIDSKVYKKQFPTFTLA